MFNQTYFLPHRFKKIGWGAVIFHFSVVLLLIILVEILNLMPVTNAGATIVYLFKYTLLIGLAMALSSREKDEDELIRLIRMRSFQYGIYLAVAFAIFQFELNILSYYISDWDIKIHGIWILPFSILYDLDTIGATMLYIAGIYEFQRYRLRKDEE
ncbi:MAG: hypothetical protein R3211_02885 [Balneolaceae bacterium]|nr:hypothetical protein [Balneolaceae bacterium]